MTRRPESRTTGGAGTLESLKSPPLSSSINSPRRTTRSLHVRDPHTAPIRAVLALRRGTNCGYVGRCQSRTCLLREPIRLYPATRAGGQVCNSTCLDGSRRSLRSLHRRACRAYPKGCTWARWWPAGRKESQQTVRCVMYCYAVESEKLDSLLLWYR